MSFLDQQSLVRYACTCGELKPISRIYFCRHCSKIRCGFCVCHEVDARYCPTCMENLPVAEAWMKRNCCSYCFTCPVCHHNLTARITTVQSKTKEKTEAGAGDKEEGKVPEKPEPPKKFYYLSCFFCHWTTRDVAIPDQITASGNWPEKENPQTARINALIEYCKSVSLSDRMTKERKQPVSRKTYTHLSGMSAAMARRKAGLPSLPSGAYGISNLQDLRKPPQIDSSIATSDVNDLPADIFTVAPDLSKVTTLDQRLGIPDLQCINTSDLRLCRRLLQTKRSQRCRECEHNVTKPEYNPGSIKFKIQLSAYYHIPDVHIKTCEPLRAGEDSHLIVKIINPTPYQTTVTLKPITDEIPDVVEEEEPTEELSSMISKRSPFMRVTPRPIKAKFTCDPVLPSSSIILPGRDDAAEYDDTTENQNFNDDPKVVVWRKGNKVAVKFAIRPHEDLEIGSDVIVGFAMNHIYTNTIIQQKDQQKITHEVKIVLTAGKVVGKQ